MKNYFRRILGVRTMDGTLRDVGPTFSPGWLRSKIKKYTSRRRIRRLLCGRSNEEMLKIAPYRYGWFQGDNGYRIMDDRKEPPFVHIVHSIEEAEIWILERYLCEIHRIPSKPIGCFEDRPQDYCPR